jgi:tripartite-type tricarboxylate transporter receptor subunit TctC
VSGHVKLTISGMPPVVQFMKAGTLKAIAVTSKHSALAGLP